VKRRALPLVLLALGALGFAWVGPKVPKDQRVDLVLGARAKDVEQVTVRWGAGDEARETTLRWSKGAAPGVVHTAPHLPDGEWPVEIEVAGAGRFGSVRRRVLLSEASTTSIEIAAALPEEKP